MTFTCLILPNRISYLLLHNKLPPNLVALSSDCHVLLFKVSASGIWKWVSWAVPPWCLWNVAVRCQLEPCKGLIILKDLFPKWHNYKVGKLGFAFCRWPFYTGLSSGLLWVFAAWGLCFLWANDPSNQGRGCKAFRDLALELTHHNFRGPLLVMQVCLGFLWGDDTWMQTKDGRGHVFFSGKPSLNFFPKLYNCLSFYSCVCVYIQHVYIICIYTHI